MDAVFKPIDVATMLTSPPMWVDQLLTFSAPLCMVVSPNDMGFVVETVTNLTRISTWCPLDASDAIRRATEQFGKIKLQVLYLRERDGGITGGITGIWAIAI
jgi:hypothetical protein